MRALVSSVVIATALLFASLTTHTAHAQPTTDARDYEGAGSAPNGTLVLLDYFRHQTTTQKKNVTTNINIFRATYVLRRGEFAFVPFDALLPVIDADLRLYTPQTGLAGAIPPATGFVPTGGVPSSTRPGSLGSIATGSSRTTGLGDIQFLPSIIYDHIEKKEDHTHTYAGANLYVYIPTGKYSTRNIVNLGDHRWQLKPQIAVGQRFAKVFTVDLVGNTVIYMKNDQYVAERSPTFLTTTLKQKATFNGEVHVAADIHQSAFVAVSYYVSAFGKKSYSGSLGTLTPAAMAAVTPAPESAVVHTLRFTWGIRITPHTLALLQYQTDVKAGGEESNTRFWGARLSHAMF